MLTLGDFSISEFRKFGAKNKHKKIPAVPLKKTGILDKWRKRLKGKPMKVYLKGTGGNKRKLYSVGGHLRKSHYVVGRTGWYGSGGMNELKGTAKRRARKVLRSQGGML